MGRNQHSFAKRQLEAEKKRKADDKRARRLERKKQRSDEQDPASDEAAIANAEHVEGAAVEPDAATPRQDTPEAT